MSGLDEAAAPEHPTGFDAIGLCFACFRDRGLRTLAARLDGPIGTCPSCGTPDIRVLNGDTLMRLSHDFFVRGSAIAADYGGAPAIVFNHMQEGSLQPEPDLAADVDLLQRTLEVGFFHYGPRLWMLGHIGPLQEMLEPVTRASAIQRILLSYPVRILNRTDEFFRVRRVSGNPTDPGEYDAPPYGAPRPPGRLDDGVEPTLYGSQDLDICIHESRFAAGDDLHVATLAPTRELRLLDLGAILRETATEFESLDLAVVMLFLAGPHAYSVTREIAAAARAEGYDGIAYPSFFSQLQTGENPFETVYGLALRRIEDFAQDEEAKIIRNLALFGRPVEDGAVAVVGINRLVITRVSYGTVLGPLVY